MYHLQMIQLDVGHRLDVLVANKLAIRLFIFFQDFLKKKQQSMIQSTSTEH